MLFNNLSGTQLVEIFRELARKYMGPRRLHQIIGTPEAPGLLDYLEKTDFFVAPASTTMGYHLGCIGGLAMHVYNFNWWMQSLIDVAFTPQGLETGIWVAHPDENVLHLATLRESAFLVALCHDLNKTIIFGKKFYEPNMTSKGQSAYKPYEINKGRVPLNHHDAVVLAGQFIDLKADEIQAIAYSEGKYDYGYRSVEGKEEVLTKFAVCADFLASKIQEDFPGLTRGHATMRQTIAAIMGGNGPSINLLDASPMVLHEDGGVRIVSPVDNDITPEDEKVLRELDMEMAGEDAFMGGGVFVGEQAQASMG